MAADPEHERDETWEDVTFDEDFIRSAETTEPSARARMLAARWRNESPEPQPWRSDKPPRAGSSAAPDAASGADASRVPGPVLFGGTQLPVKAQ